MDNQTMIQYFEWYLPEDGQHWNRAKGEAEHLKSLGITHVWLPPAYKGAGGIKEVGYAVYDMYDLGEFDQKGTIPTKYGTKDEYLKAIDELHKQEIQVLGDVVFNQRLGADECETVKVTKDSNVNRNQHIGSEQEILAWTKFTFPGRNGKYSDFQWDFTCFDGVDWDEKTKTSGLYQFAGKSWDGEVDSENGNYDYLMGADLDLSNPKVLEELDAWGKWYLETTGIDGFRVDAVKHIRFSFFIQWLTKLKKESGKELFTVGEYWNSEVNALKHYLNKSGLIMRLFDSPLHFNFFRASNAGGSFDMQRILEGSLVKERPDRAVTFIGNHDTQPGQALNSWIQGWFRALAYALILLREDGIPCVFYGDLYGIPHDYIDPVGKQLTNMLIARKLYAYGEQVDYFDHSDIVGFTRLGDTEHKNSAMAVILSDGPGGNKEMCVGSVQAGKVFYDCLLNHQETIMIEENGCALFPVNGGSVSVWVSTDTQSSFD